MGRMIYTNPGYDGVRRAEGIIIRFGKEEYRINPVRQSIEGRQGGEQKNLVLSFFLLIFNNYKKE